jgi:hypothetical protein
MRKIVSPARFCLRFYDSTICLPFFKHLSRDYEKTTITAMYHGRWFAYINKGYSKSIKAVRRQRNLGLIFISDLSDIIKK